MDNRTNYYIIQFWLKNNEEESNEEENIEQLPNEEENTEQLPKAIEFTGEETVEWRVAIRRGQNSRISIVFHADAMFNFISQLIAEGLLNLDMIDKIVICDTLIGTEEKDLNVINGEDIDNILLTSSHENHFIEINLTGLKNYPSLIRNTEKQRVED